MEKPKPFTLRLIDEQQETHEIVRLYYKDPQTQKDTQILEEEYLRRKSDQASDGLRRAFYRDGTLWCEELWRNGKLWEVMLDFLPDGSPVENSGIKDGRGHQRVFCEDGTLSEEGEYDEGARHGEWRFFYPDGAPKAKGRYDHGERVGLWEYYHESGALSATEERNGKEIYQKTFSEDGALREEGLLVDTSGWHRSGLWKSYTPGKPTRFTDHASGFRKVYYDPEGLLAATAKQQNPALRMQEMLDIVDRSRDELFASFDAWIEQGKVLPLPLALELACIASSRAAALSALRYLDAHGEAALPALEQRASAPKMPSGMASAVLVLALQNALSERPLPPSYDALLARGLLAVEKEWRNERLRESLQHLLRRLPLDRREPLVFGGAAQGGQVLLSVARACPTDRVLTATLAAILAIKRRPNPTAALYNNIHDALESFAGENVALLVSALSGPANPAVHDILLFALAKTRHPDAIPILCDAMRGRKVRLKNIVRTELPLFGDVAIPALEDVIKNEPGVARFAVQVFAKLPKTDAKREAARRLSAISPKAFKYHLR